MASQQPTFQGPSLPILTPDQIAPRSLANFPRCKDILGCQEALYEWVESYDTKDWGRLAKCIAPTLRVDYRSFLNKLWEAMPADDFVQMVSSLHFLGNKRIKTQHLVGGAARWTKTSDIDMVGYHQMRVAHQKYEDEELTRIAVKGHAHGMATVLYRKVSGAWKFAGIEPGIRWSEYDHDKIFQPDENA